jgi:hypothetical protein
MICRLYFGETPDVQIFIDILDLEKHVENNKSTYI